MIKIKITWPAAILILVAVLIWLSRPSAPAQPKPQPIEHPEPRVVVNRPHRHGKTSEWKRHKADIEPVVIIDQRREGREEPGTQDAPDEVTYEEAIRAPLGTYTHSQIDAIANRELREAAQEGFESAHRDNPFFVRTPAWRKQS